MVAGVDDLAFAVVLGTAFGLGVCLLVSLAPRWGAPSLARRIAPYIRDVTDPRGVGVGVKRRAARCFAGSGAYRACFACSSHACERSLSAPRTAHESRRGALDATQKQTRVV